MLWSAIVEDLDAFYVVASNAAIALMWNWVEVLILTTLPKTNQPSTQFLRTNIPGTLRVHGDLKKLHLLDLLEGV